MGIGRVAEEEEEEEEDGMEIRDFLSGRAEIKVMHGLGSDSRKLIFRPWVLMFGMASWHAHRGLRVFCGLTDMADCTLDV